MSEDYTRLADHYELPLPDGTTLYLKNQVTPRIKADYQAWISGNARREVMDTAPTGKTGDDEADIRAQREFDLSHKAHLCLAAAGAFKWGGDVWRSSFTQLPGLIKMVELLANACGKTPFDDDKCSKMCGNDVSLHLAMEAVRQIMDATPNFISPPEVAVRKV